MAEEVRRVFGPAIANALYAFPREADPGVDMLRSLFGSGFYHADFSQRPARFAFKPEVETSSVLCCFP